MMTLYSISVIYYILVRLVMQSEKFQMMQEQELILPAKKNLENDLPFKDWKKQHL